MTITIMHAYNIGPGGQWPLMILVGTEREGRREGLYYLLTLYEQCERHEQ